MIGSERLRSTVRLIEYRRVDSGLKGIFIRRIFFENTVLVTMSHLHPLCAMQTVGLHNNGPGSVNLRFYISAQPPRLSIPPGRA